MRSKWMKVSGVFAIALTLVVAACDSLSESQLVGPGERSADLVIETDDDGFMSVRESDPTVGVVTAIIDREGGVLSIGEHTLVVPKGAVIAPTTFVMSKLSDRVEVSLTATQVTLNDVGSVGFRKNLTLTMSYANGIGVDEDELTIAWLKPDGTHEVLPSWVNREGDKVSASVDHFSDYGVGWPGQGGCEFEPCGP